jgi:hypothetical protein
MRSSQLTKDSAVLSGSSCQYGHTSNLTRLPDGFRILQLSDIVFHWTEIKLRVFDN